jgi:hypothetical protein
MGLNCAKPGGCNFPRELCLASCSFTSRACLHRPGQECPNEVACASPDGCLNLRPEPSRPIPFPDRTAGVQALHEPQRCMHGNGGTCPQCKVMEERLEARRDQAAADYGAGRARLANTRLTGENDAPDAA